MPKQTRSRDASKGRFVSPETAKANPETTVTETVNEPVKVDSDLVLAAIVGIDNYCPSILPRALLQSLGDINEYWLGEILPVIEKRRGREWQRVTKAVRATIDAARE